MFVFSKQNYATNICSRNNARLHYLFENDVPKNFQKIYSIIRHHFHHRCFHQFSKWLRINFQTLPKQTPTTYFLDCWDRPDRADATEWSSSYSWESATEPAPRTAGLNRGRDCWNDWRRMATARRGSPRLAPGMFSVKFTRLHPEGIHKRSATAVERAASYSWANPARLAWSLCLWRRIFLQMTFNKRKYCPEKCRKITEHTPTTRKNNNLGSTEKPICKWDKNCRTWDFISPLPLP